MAIEKNNSKVSRFDSEHSMGSKSRDTASSGGGDDELRRKSPVDSEEDDEFDDADSGAGSDDLESLELGESGSEFCQVGDQSCQIPLELYDLADLSDILSLDVWNECLTEEERFGLTQYLPDMDQETFMHTLKELFDGSNFHFGSPVIQLFEMLKGGLCEPRVSLYRQGLNIFQRHQHYHIIREYQNSMVSNLLQMRDAWQNCKGYSIDEKLRVLNITRSQRSLMGEKMEHMAVDTSDRDRSIERPRDVRPKGQNTGRDSSYRVSPSLELIPRGKPIPVEQAKHGKPNPKGVLKLVKSKTGVQKEIVADDPRPKGKQKSVPHGSTSPISRLGKSSGYDSRGMPSRMRRQMTFQDVDNDYEETSYQPDPYSRDLNETLGSFLDQSGSSRPGKRRQVSKGEKYAGERYMDMPVPLRNGYSTYGRNMNVNQLSDIKVLTAKPSSSRHLNEIGKKGKRHVESTFDHLHHRAPPFRGMSKGSHHEFLEEKEPYGNVNTRPETGFDDSAFQYDNWDARGMKGKMGKDFSDLKARLARSPHQFMDGIHLQPGKRARPLQNKITKASVATSLKPSRNYDQREETESGSSDHFDKEEEDNPLMLSKVAYPGPPLENSPHYATKSGVGTRKVKILKKNRKESSQTLNTAPPNSRITVDSNGHLQSLNAENYSLDDRHGDDLQIREPLHVPASGPPEDSNYDGSEKSNIKSKKSKKASKKGLTQGSVGGNSAVRSKKLPPFDRKQRESVGYDVSYDQSAHSPFFEENDSLLADGRSQKAEVDDHDSMLVGCSSAMRKRKAEAFMDGVDEVERSDFAHLNGQQQQDVSNHLMKRARKKVDVDCGVPDLEMLPSPVVDTVVIDEQPEKKPQKKPFILIKPTVHTDFSFSVVLLLSAVRLAMITPKPDSSEHLENPEKQNGEHQDMNGSLENMDTKKTESPEQLINGSSENMDLKKTECPEQLINGPLLTVQEIVDRVRSNPGDPCILETQEPLQDLVRGVLKTFSSRTAPLGAKGWKPLICYEKSAKSWSWIGPIPQVSLVLENSQEIASPEFWGIPHKMLVKLVDSFANWLKSGQETLRQLGSLPPPPAELMQNVDEKERFRDLRAQKSLITINPSTDEVRAYFRKEEELRYSVPDRAFSYTAADGKKSIVAPLRRGGGKPTSKARDHFMLKRDRPPHVTILCLVRDAAARLPGSIGTRADVCTLIRDSQYIVEDVTDAQVNQVVSGALDRLHYERDPCVLFDGERKLWVYLHREREEEDFEDDGTSSTKKWRRQKKDPSEQCDQEAAAVACPGSGGEQAGSDHGSDLNADPCNENDKGTDATFDSTTLPSEDNAENCQVLEQDNIHTPQPMMWESLGLDPMQDDKLMCQENAMNDFDATAFNEEQPLNFQV